MRSTSSRAMTVPVGLSGVQMQIMRASRMCGRSKSAVGRKFVSGPTVISTGTPRMK